MIRPVPTAQRRRYYWHGDRYEEDPSLYFCALCDWFLGADHFASDSSGAPHSAERHQTRLAASRLAFARRVTLGHAVRRPQDTENILIGRNVVFLAPLRQRRRGCRQ